MSLKDLCVGAVLLLLLRVQCLHGSALPAVSSYEFTAYRMQQYNLAQQTHGKFREKRLPFIFKYCTLHTVSRSTLFQMQTVCAHGVIFPEIEIIDRGKMILRFHHSNHINHLITPRIYLLTFLSLV